MTWNSEMHKAQAALDKAKIKVESQGMSYGERFNRRILERWPEAKIEYAGVQADRYAVFSQEPPSYSVTVSWPDGMWSHGGAVVTELEPRLEFLLDRLWNGRYNRAERLAQQEKLHINSLSLFKSVYGQRHNIVNEDE